MNTNDDETPNDKRQPDGSDLGPEPEWLDLSDEPSTQEFADPQPEPAQTREVPQEILVTAPARERVVSPNPTMATPATTAVKRDHPWMWAAVPLVLLVITAVVAWFASHQGLNDLTTWQTLRFQHAPLLPARWAMLSWWIVLPLLGVFLVYALLPIGRTRTHIRRTGPMIGAGLVASCLWIVAQHWRWEEVSVISMVVAVILFALSYFVVALDKAITKVWQRLISVLPLSATLAFGLWLLTISWQAYSDQPFGGTGTSLLLMLLCVMLSAVFAFFLKDGAVGIVFTVWFVGVAQFQWGNETIISLSAIVALLLTAATAGLGTLLAAESQRPSLTSSLSAGKGRVSFFRRSHDSTSQELP